MGVIVRDHAGTVVACKAAHTVGTSSAYAAELWAMTHAFDLASELGPIRVEMETDSQRLANAMSNPAMDFSKHAVVLDDLKMQMRTWFSVCEIKKCCRKANMAAHCLAKIGLC